MAVTCRHCGKVYSNQSNLNRHLKENHGLNSEIIAYEKDLKSFKCLEGCDISFRLNSELVDHLQKKHNFKMEQESREFPTIEGM